MNLQTLPTLPTELIDIILTFNNDINLCIELKQLRYYPLIKLNYTIDDASSNGHLEVVKYLHSIGKDCTTHTMNCARSFRCYKILEFNWSPSLVNTLTLFI